MINTDKRLPALCKRDRCTACGSCYNSCKFNAINMQEDSNGFLHPVIDNNNCTGCLLCEKNCPINFPPVADRNELPDVYACWHKDSNVRMASSSGGMFSAIAEVVLSEGGIVWGAAYTPKLELEYQYIDKINDLDKLRRSKYVQSRVGNAFEQIKTQLNQNKTVMFCGTPCHVNGLYRYLRKDYNKLITLDFICHGVPSPKVFRIYLDWIEKKYKDQLLDFNFRDKRYGWDNGILTVGIFKNQGEKAFFRKQNSFFYGMLHDLFIRDSCYQCESNGVKRNADFTIGDFWGIGKDIPFKHETEKLKGISMVALNSAKAVLVFEEMLTQTIHSEKRSIEEAYNGNYNYRYSAKKPDNRDLFFLDMNNGRNWDYLIREYLTPTAKEQITIFIKKNFGPAFTNKLKKYL